VRTDHQDGRATCAEAGRARPSSPTWAGCGDGRLWLAGRRRPVVACHDRPARTRRPRRPRRHGGPSSGGTVHAATEPAGNGSGDGRWRGPIGARPWAPGGRRRGVRGARRGRRDRRRDGGGVAAESVGQRWPSTRRQRADARCGWRCWPRSRPEAERVYPGERGRADRRRLEDRGLERGNPDRTCRARWDPRAIPDGAALVEANKCDSGGRRARAQAGASGEILEKRTSEQASKTALTAGNVKAGQARPVIDVRCDMRHEVEGSLIGKGEPRS